MKRRKLVELHEEPWIPDSWRRIFQDGLGTATVNMKIYHEVIPKLRELLERTASTKIFDLCSGSAAVTIDLWWQLSEQLGEANRPKLILSDLYPNIPKMERARADHPDSIEIHAQPVDALEPPEGEGQIRSMISALHHFDPPEIRAILTDAARSSAGILVLEHTHRNWGSLLRNLPLPIPVAFLTAFGLRPWQPSHLIWGLLLPVIPLMALWDGIVSTLRSYSEEELRAIQCFHSLRTEFENTKRTQFTKGKGSSIGL